MEANELMESLSKRVGTELAFDADVERFVNTADAWRNMPV